MVKRDRRSKYATILKNSVTHIEAPELRIFLIKNLAAAEEAVRMMEKAMEVEAKL